MKYRIKQSEPLDIEIGTTRLKFCFLWFPIKLTYHRLDGSYFSEWRWLEDTVIEQELVEIETIVGDVIRESYIVRKWVNKAWGSSI